MAADKLKKLEERGRAAFIQGDLTAATRFFTRALEKRCSGGSQPGCEAHDKKTSSPELSTRESMQRKDVVRTKSKLSPQPSCTSLTNNEEKVWILQSRPRENRVKEKGKKSRRKGKGKDDDEIVSGIEILDGIINEADVSIKSYPNYPLSYLRKASALIILNQWDEARKTYITGLARCAEKSILKSALLNLNRALKVTLCAASLDLDKLSNFINQNGPSPRTTFLPPTPSTLRRNKFRLQCQRRLTKKIFNSEDEDVSTQIQTMRYRRRNSSSTDTHF